MSSFKPCNIIVSALGEQVTSKLIEGENTSEVFTQLVEFTKHQQNGVKWYLCEVNLYDYRTTYYFEMYKSPNVILVYKVISSNRVYLGQISHNLINPAIDLQRFDENVMGELFDLANNVFLHEDNE